ncbi:MAG: DUF3179 domain-containing protein [Pontiella sp.]
MLAGWVACVSAEGRYNEFDVSNATIPLSEIHSGGPPRDGIPSIDHPKFISSGAADYMRDADEVVSVTMGKETRAYPFRILASHEIVNDDMGGQPIAITYCPLCGTAMVFSRRIDGRTLDFGVSGMLYQSDVLMYDRQTDSLWSQLGMSAVSGPLVNTPLQWLPSEQLTWAAWKIKYPRGKVLSTKTGVARNYSANAYARYKQSSDTMFPVPSYRTELPKKEWVIGVRIAGVASAYPMRALPPKQTIHDTVNDIAVEISYDAAKRQVQVIERTSGKALPSVKVYWFAWQAFYPETKLWQARPEEMGKDERAKHGQSGSVGR